MKTADERFWGKVDKHGPVPEQASLGRCWVWTGARQSDGYGSFWLHGHVIGAHVASYILNIGPIPDGLYVCHKCDRPACIRPGHLFTGTQSENIRDAYSKNRIKCLRGKRHHNYRKDVRGSVVARLYGRMGIKPIARRLGISRDCVRARLVSLGVRIRPCAEAQQIWRNGQMRARPTFYY